MRGPLIRFRSLALLLFLAAPAAGREPAEETVSASPAPESRLAWLAGCWGEDGTTSTEECWTAPRGGMLLGLHRDTSPRGTFFEYLRIERDDEGGLIYHASPMGGDATAFRLVAIDDRSVRFENPEHDWPQRIVYRLGHGGDTLHVRAEGLDESSRRVEWTWRRRPGFD